jgi:hypothetical protein
VRQALRETHSLIPAIRTYAPQHNANILKLTSVKSTSHAFSKNSRLAPRHHPALSSNHGDDHRSNSPTIYPLLYSSMKLKVSKAEHQRRRRVPIRIRQCLGVRHGASQRKQGLRCGDPIHSYKRKRIQIDMTARPVGPAGRVCTETVLQQTAPPSDRVARAASACARGAANSKVARSPHAAMDQSDFRSLPAASLFRYTAKYTSSRTSESELHTNPL